MRPVYVLGAGAIAWGKYPATSQVDMALSAMNAALQDAGMTWRQLEGVVAASSRFEGGMGWGLHANELIQAANEQPIPCINVGGACAAGAIAFYTAFNMVASGQCESVAVIGAERMPKGFIPRPPGGSNDIFDEDYLRWVSVGATNPAYWALEAQRRRFDMGTDSAKLALASVLMRQNAANNPNARFRTPLTAQSVLASPVVTEPLHLLQICPVSDGAAALILGANPRSDDGNGAITVAGAAIASGEFGDPARRIPTLASNVLDGVSHTSEVINASRKAMAMAGVEPSDVDILELADNTAWHLFAWPELLGFVEPGQSDWMFEHDRFSINGDLALNPSGGFLSFGEATTAQAVMQICELVWQLRGTAGPRQVPDAQVAMSAVLGLGANAGSVVLKT